MRKKKMREKEEEIEEDEPVLEVEEDGAYDEK